MRGSKCSKCKYYRVENDGCKILGCSPLSGYKKFKLADDVTLERRKIEIEKLEKHINLVHNILTVVFIVWLIYSVIISLFTLQVMLSNSQVSHAEVLLSLIREYPIQYMIVLIGGVLVSTDIL